MLVGGSLGFNSITDKATSGSTTSTVGTTTTFTISPNFGYFVIDNLAIGGNISYISSKDELSSVGGSITGSGFTFSPLARYYFGPGIFGQGTFGFGSAKDGFSAGSTSSTINYTVSVWSLGAGYAYFLNDHIAIEPILICQSTSRKAVVQEVQKMFLAA